MQAHRPGTRWRHVSARARSAGELLALAQSRGEAAQLVATGWMVLAVALLLDVARAGGAVPEPEPEPVPVELAPVPPKSGWAEDGRPFYIDHGTQARLPPAASVPRCLTSAWRGAVLPSGPRALPPRGVGRQRGRGPEAAVAAVAHRRRTGSRQRPRRRPRHRRTARRTTMAPRSSRSARGLSERACHGAAGRWRFLFG